MSALLLATRNEHKLRELREALPGVEIDPLPPEIELPPEDGDTFAQNALGKARAAHAATGRAAVADDSGIEAYGLDGRPGTPALSRLTSRGPKSARSIVG
jgi:XTP/dITP diphosphohydrolase